MKLRIVAVGDKQPDWVDAAFADYARRMPRTARVELVTIRPEPRRATRTAAQCVSVEAERIASAIPAGSRRVVLDERGRDLTTRALADLLRRWIDDGRDCALVIGGADGLDPALTSSAEASIRLSSLTLPHGLARVVLAEQLYRAVSILGNHPYHRE